jgi:septum formation inhibitor-activating ATPase MinD
MGKVILCTSPRRYIGKTTTALNLGKVISDLINQSVIAVDLDVVSKDFFNILSEENTYSYKNVDIVMSYAVKSKGLEEVINANKETLINSKFDVMFGTRGNDLFSDNQYINFIESIKKIYPISIIDWNADYIPNVIKERVDCILVLVDQDKRGLLEIKQKNGSLLNNPKTLVAVNRYNEKILSLGNIEKIIHKDISFTIPYDIEVIKKVNSKNLNMNGTKYEESIKEISYNILKQFNIKTFKKSTIFSFNKKRKVGEELNVELTR